MAFTKTIMEKSVRLLSICCVLTFAHWDWMISLNCVHWNHQSTSSFDHIIFNRAKYHYVSCTFCFCGNKWTRRLIRLAVGARRHSSSKPFTYLKIFLENIIISTRWAHPLAICFFATTTLFPISSFVILARSHNAWLLTCALKLNRRIIPSIVRSIINMLWRWRRQTVISTLMFRMIFVGFGQCPITQTFLV